MPQVAGVWCSSCEHQPCGMNLFKESCLCTTPDLRSFHMGIALSKFSLLQDQLDSFRRRIRDQLECMKDAQPRLTYCAESTSSVVSHQQPVSAGVWSPHPRRAIGRPPVNRTAQRNWPFIVQPAPKTKMACDFSTGFADSVPEVNSSIKVIRKSVASGSSHLVLSGRMADVCAELERLSVLEARQT